MNCKECKVTFKYQCDFSRHLKSKRHLKRVTGITHYTCDLCALVCRDNYDFQKHQKVCKKREREPECQCDICERDTYETYFYANEKHTWDICHFCIDDLKHKRGEAMSWACGKEEEVLRKATAKPYCIKKPKPVNLTDIIKCKRKMSIVIKELEFINQFVYQDTTWCTDTCCRDCVFNIDQAAIHWIIRHNLGLPNYE